MFTLPREENPLDMLVAEAGTGFVQNQLARQAEAAKLKKVEGALSGLTSDSSDIDWLQAINRAPQEYQPGLLKFYENVSTKNLQRQKAEAAQQANKPTAAGAKQAGLPFEEYSQLSSAERQQALKNAGRRPPGGVTAQPVPAEIGAKIKQTLEANKGKTADELAVAFDEAEVPRIFSNSYIETARRRDEKQGAREDILESEQAKADIAYQKTIPEAIKTLQHHKEVTDRFEELNKKGVTGKPYEKFLERVGLINLTSEGRREAGSLQKEYTKDIRQILGAQFSAQEFFTILNSYPSPDFSKSANQAIIDNYRIWDDIKEKDIEIANDLLKENKGRPPRNFELEVANRVREYANTRVPEMRRNIEKLKGELENEAPPGKVLLYDPEGQILHADPADVEEYIRLGATRP